MSHTDEPLGRQVLAGAQMLFEILSLMMFSPSLGQRQ